MIPSIPIQIFIITVTDQKTSVGQQTTQELHALAQATNQHVNFGKDKIKGDNFSDQKQPKGKGKN